MSDKKKEKGFLETVREIDEAERKAELEEETRREEERLRKEEEARKAYEERLKRERLELLKRKQGLIEEPVETEKVPEKHYTVWERISNFVYHNNIYLIFGVATALLVGFLIYDTATTERPDISMFFIATDYNMELVSGNITEEWAEYCPDVNGDGKQIARLYYVPANYESNDTTSMSYAQSDRTKIFGEFQSGTTIIFIGTKQDFADLGVYDTGTMYDARELFPDDEYAEEIGYRLAGTDFAELLGYTDMEDEDLYVAFRKPQKTIGDSEETMQENFDIAVEFWREFLADHRIDGLELPETAEPDIAEAEYEY